jgi:hypothetical protein
MHGANMKISSENFKILLGAVNYDLFIVLLITFIYVFKKIHFLSWLWIQITELAHKLET